MLQPLKWLKLTILLIALINLSACANSPNSSTTTPTCDNTAVTTETIKTNDLEITAITPKCIRLNSHFDLIDNESTFSKFKIKNTTDKPVNLGYESDGNLINIVDIFDGSRQVEEPYPPAPEWNIKIVKTHIPAHESVEIIAPSYSGYVASIEKEKMIEHLKNGDLPINYKIQYQLYAFLYKNTKGAKNYTIRNNDVADAVIRHNFNHVVEFHVIPAAVN